ncbi:MAG: metal-dependent hydrolase [Candidatus Binatia bacterium]
MGPGLALKSVIERRMSLTVFGFSQLLIDLEPGIGLVRGSPVLHGVTHTFVGATLIGLVATVLGRPLCQRLMLPTYVISWPAAAAGAFIGTYSHILLDGTMHLDMRPLAPFSDANPLLGTAGIATTYIGCVVAGLVGWMIMRVRAERVR